MLTKNSVKKVIVKTLAIVFLLVFMFAGATYGAFQGQGIVTGRIYERLADPSDTVFDELDDIGLQWVRIEFEEFYDLDEEGGPYDFSSPEVQANKLKFQNLINNAKARGLKVLGVCANSSFPMKSYPDFPLTEASLQAYVNGVQWHLQNYQIDAIEIWNECAGFGVDKNRYAKMSIMAYEQLKPLYPDVLFVGPVTPNAEKGDWIGLSPNDYEKTIFNCTDMLNYRAANNGKVPYDRISWHPYGTGGDPYGDFYFGRNFDTYYNEILDYKDKTGRNVIGDTPIWFTEYGYDSNNIGEEYQRIYTERIIGKMYEKSQVEIPFLYVYADDEPVVGSEGKAHGIRKNSTENYERKRVYFPFMAHSNLVGLFTPDGYQEWTVDEIGEAYFEHGAKDNLGRPWRAPGAPWYGDKAHYWGPGNSGCIQEFNYGAIGKNALLYKWNTGKAYLLMFGFYSYYVDNGGPGVFGWPTSNEYQSGGYTWQNFENGRLRWSVETDVTWHPY